MLPMGCVVVVVVVLGRRGRETTSVCNRFSSSATLGLHTPSSRVVRKCVQYFRVSNHWYGCHSWDLDDPERGPERLSRLSSVN